MAILHPSTRPIASDGVSQAELDVLDALASGPPDWHVLHSLWLKSHQRKRDAEVDFIVVTSAGVLCLEAKGGDVWRDDAGWHFRPKRGGKEDVRPHGPIDQCAGACMRFVTS
ncbi:MAG: NERD domain-containing protein [Betaproteobacteria bacterium]|nr:NERD domain-containing protein [Betaproteobacteria bacterium]